MTVTSTRSGGPFTRKVYRQPEDLEDIKEFLEGIKEFMDGLGAAACSPEEHLVWWLEACRAELDAGDAPEPFRHPSREWYMRAIAQHAETTLGAAANGNLWGAIGMGMRFARLVKEFEVRDYQLHHAKAGGHEKAKQDREGKSNRAKRNERMRREYEERRAIAPATVSDTKIKIEIGKKHGLGRSGALEVLADHNSSGVRSKPDS